MGDEGQQPEKREVARSLLIRGSMFVHLDPRVDGVVVPPWLRKQPQLVLQVGLDMPVPIPDLRIDRDGVYATLSFNRSPFTCVVGWDAVFALSGEDGRGMVWPESMPSEILAEVEREAGKRAPAGLSLEEDEEESAWDEDDEAFQNVVRLDRHRPPTPRRSPPRPMVDRDRTAESADEGVELRPQPALALSEVSALEDEGTDDGERAAEVEPDGGDDDPTPPPQRGHLRLVK